MREILENFHPPKISCPEYYPRETKETRRDKGSVKHSFKGTLQVCLTAELSKSALCRCQVEKKCLEEALRATPIKGLRRGLCAELNMTAATTADSEILIYEAT